jgi:ferric-dicitrate binding protein FerR (iron transport regulator)
MASLIRQVVALLNRLIQLEYDAIEACRFAVAGATNPGDRARFGAWAADHRRHVEDLASLVRNLGGEPAARVLRTPAPQHAQERDLLRAVHRRIALAYADAASQPGIPVDVLATLERAAAEERALTSE